MTKFTWEHVHHRSPNPEETAQWYQDKLGLGSEWGIMFPWPRDAGEDPLSLLSAFEETTDYMAPSTDRFMINLRVDDLDAFVADLEAKGIEILGRQADDYGKFAWIMDCDGIKIELWQQ